MNMHLLKMFRYEVGSDDTIKDLTTYIDDLHKPALDGIGYQDLIQEQMVGETSTYQGGGQINQLKHLAANQVPLGKSKPYFKDLSCVSSSFIQLSTNVTSFKVNLLSCSILELRW